MRFSGFGVSERLFAFLAGKPIREAQLFPLLRPNGRRQVGGPQYVRLPQYIRPMQATSPESNAALLQGSRFSHTAPGCPSLGGQRTHVWARTVAAHERRRSNGPRAVPSPFAVSCCGLVPALGASVAQTALLAIAPAQPSVPADGLRPRLN